MEMHESSQQQVVLAKERRLFNTGLFVVVSVNLAILIMASWALARFGSIRDCIAYYSRGETLFADSREKSFGTVAPDDRVSVSFKLTNRGSQPTRVLGCYSRCGYLVPNDLPFALGPNESRSFELSIHIPPNQYAASFFSKIEIVLCTNNPLQSRIPLVIRGENGPKSIPSNPKS